MLLQVPPEVLLQIADHLHLPSRTGWIVGTGCCSERRLGPGASLCGPLPNEIASAATKDMRALAATCWYLRQLLRPQALGALRVRLEHGLLKKGPDDSELDTRGINVLRRPEGYYYSSDVLPTDTLLDVSDLPHQGTPLVRYLDLALQSWHGRQWRRARPPGSSSGSDDESDSVDGDGTAPPKLEGIQGREGAVAVLEKYPALRRLDLSLRYSHHGDPAALRPLLCNAVARLEHLTALRLCGIILGGKTPTMPTVRSIQTNNADIRCWDSFPDLVDLRMEHQTLFAPALFVPWTVLRRLKHFTYCPPDNLDENKWIPNQCKKIGAIQRGEVTAGDRDLMGYTSSQAIDNLPLRELVINAPIFADHLVDMVRGLATLNLHIFVCFGLFLFRHENDMGREGEITELVREAFPGVCDERLVFEDNSKLWREARENRNREEQHEHAHD